MMLKKIAILLIFTSIVCVARAQRSYHPTFDIGAKGGITFSNQQFSPEVEQKTMMGFLGGICFRYSEEKLFGLLAELNIEQRGWEEDFDNNSLNYKRHLTYLNLPIMTHINFGGRVFRGFINLGPSIGYMLSSSISSNFNYKDVANVEGFPTDRHVAQMAMEVKNKFDYGIVGGAGIELRFNKNFFLLEGRYYFGLGNIFSSAKKDYFSASRGTAIEVSLSYMFRLKH